MESFAIHINLLLQEWEALILKIPFNRYASCIILPSVVVPNCSYYTCTKTTTQMYPKLLIVLLTFF